MEKIREFMLEHVTVILKKEPPKIISVITKALIVGTLLGARLLL